MTDEGRNIDAFTTSTPQHRKTISPTTSAAKTRARTGCNVCRARKVKCDEQRPSCQKCIRLKRVCVYRLPSSNLALHEPLEHQVTETDERQQDHHNILNREEHVEHEIESSRHPASSQPNFWAPTPDTSSTGLTNASPVAVAGPADLGVQVPNDAAGSSSSHNHANLYATNQFDEADAPTSLLHSTPQFIYLTTVIDWMGLSKVPATDTFSYFLEVVDCPLLSPFDQLNWLRVKKYIAHAGLQQSTIADFLRAVQALYRSQVDHLPSSHGMTLHQKALKGFETATTDSSIDFEILLVCAFLQCLFAVTIPNEDGPCLGALDGPLTERLEASLQNKPHSAIYLRICAWMQLLNTAVKHSGSAGLFGNPILKLLHSHALETPILSPLDHDTHPDRGLYDAVAAPVFSFYMELQKISNQVTDMTHYRRSRSTAADQEEVNNVSDTLKTNLADLWHYRPPPLRLDPAKIREHFSAAIADPLITLSGLCIAAFHVEIIVIGRILGNTPFPNPEAENAMRQIRHVVEGEWVPAADADEALSPGYTRPLFVYALESLDKSRTDWAARQLRRIKHPNSNGNFLASFVEAHGEAQRAQGRRVTMKYFCYQSFGVPLPFM